MRMFKLINSIASLCIGNAVAGTGWYVNIQNNTPVDVAINFAGNDIWYCNDFCGPQLVKAGQNRVFYTEEAQPYNGVPGIQGIDLSGPYAAHVEFWTAIRTSQNRWVQHAHSVNLNINHDYNVSEMVYVGSDNLDVDTGIVANPAAGTYGTVYADVYVDIPQSNI